MIANKVVIFGRVSSHGEVSGTATAKGTISGMIESESDISGSISESVVKLDPYPIAEKEAF